MSEFQTRSDGGQAGPDSKGTTVASLVMPISLGTISLPSPQTKTEDNFKMNRSFELETVLSS